MVFKKCFQFCMIPLAIAFLIACGFHDSGAAEKRPLTWGTGPTTSGTYTYFVVASRILNEKIPEVNITLRATGGVVHAARLLEKGDVDIGPIDTTIAWELAQGKGNFEGKPFRDLRLLYVNMTNVLQFVVSEKSGVKDIYGLEGKAFAPGTLGSSAEKVTADILRTLGVHPKVRHMGLADAIEAMSNDTIIGFTKYGTPPDATIMEIASAKSIRVLSFSEEDREKILKNAVGLRKTAVPPGTYGGAGEVKTFENEYTDFVRKEFPAELAYKIVKIIWENRSEIKKINSMFLGDRLPEVSLGVKTNYMHPGAIKFYREMGLTVPKNLIPPEMGEK